MASDVCVSYLASICLLFTAFVLVGSDQALYELKDPLSILNNHNFYSVIPHTNNGWFVNFYSSWCGHCIRFAPDWKQLAIEVQGWNPIMQIAVVDCAQEENLKLCRDYNIEAYPTLKWINAFSVKGDKGTVYDGARGPEDMIHAMIDYLHNITASPNAPRILPNLRPLKSLEDIWNNVNSATRFTAVLFEDNKSYLGRELILDFATRKNMVLRRMTKEHSSKLGVKVFPSLYFIKELGVFEKVALGTDRKGFAKALNTLLGISEDKYGIGIEDAQRSSHFNSTLTRIGANNHVYMSDLVSSLHYSLRQEIACHKNISGSSLDALKSFIRVLAKYFPGAKSVVEYLGRISKWMENLQGTLSGDEWMTQIAMLQEESEVLGEEIKWVGCKGSILKYRGYPCSLWTLFHTLTVNSVIDAANSPRFNHLEVLLAMRGYIDKFFGCRECSHHFMKMAVSIETEVKSPDDAIIWLWRAHNKANHRLHGDITEDPFHPKIQFPPKSICPKCRSNSQQSHQNNSFNIDEVLLFLKQYFSQKNILRKSDLTIGDSRVLVPQDMNGTFLKRGDLKSFASKSKLGRKKLLFRDSPLHDIGSDVIGNRVQKMRAVEFESRSRKSSAGVLSQWGLNSVDISLCVLFYLVCCGILLLVYCHLSHYARVHCKRLGKGYR